MAKKKQTAPKGGVISSNARVRFEYLNLLKDNADKMLNTGIFSRTRMQDKLTFLGELANARSDSWQTVQVQYPPIEGYSQEVINCCTLRYIKEQ